MLSHLTAWIFPNDREGNYGYDVVGLGEGGLSQNKIHAVICGYFLRL